MGEMREFRLPDVGEGLTEAEILTWHVRPGDTVTVNQPIVEIETAKAAVELPSPFAGTVTALHVEAGEVVPVGTPIITLDLGGPPEACTPRTAQHGTTATGDGSPPPTGTPAQEPTRTAVLVGYGVKESAGAPRRRARVPAAQPTGAPAPEQGPAGEAGRPVRIGGLEAGRQLESRLSSDTPVKAKPPVRRLARELGVDLSAVDPTGTGGVVTRDDVERAARLHSATAPSPSPAAQQTVVPQYVARSSEVREERVPVRGVLRAMAEAMVRSAFTAPHVTEWVDVDVTRSMELLERLRSRPELDGVKLTPMTLVAAGLVQAARAYPRINATFDGDAGEVVVHHYVNLGVAAATERGLVVPNVKDADRLGVADLARAIQRLTDDARAGRTTPSDMLGGTLTLTNVGVFGVDGGTPIINPGEVAILAAGRVLPRPWVVDGEVVARQVMQLSLSFDHRCVDGALGSTVLSYIADFLTDPGVALAMT